VAALQLRVRRARCGWWEAWCGARTVMMLGPGPNESAAAAAYIFSLPLVLVNITLGIHKAGLQAPTNTLLPRPWLSGPAEHNVVEPNVDTLYTTAWLDLRQAGGVVVLEAPDTHGRFWMFQMMDAFTNTFASPGARVSGTKGGRWAVCDADWNGTLPTGVERIDAPTRHVWILGRTQVQGEDDIAAAVKVQTSFSLRCCEAFNCHHLLPCLLAPPPHEAAAARIMASETPPQIVANMSASEFFGLAAKIMANGDLPSPPDPVNDALLARAGIVVGCPLNWSALSAATKFGLTTAMPIAKDLLDFFSNHPPGAKSINGWSYEPPGVGNYSTDYSLRAGVALRGLGANPEDDAIYTRAMADSEGRSLIAGGCYSIRFERGATPPVHGFWSVTAYDNAGYLLPNVWKKYAVSSWENLTVDSTDGSLTLLLQPTPPANPLLESNWLPIVAQANATDAKIQLNGRAYWPGPALLNKQWTWPALNPCQ
jgi:hypothetical protein